MKRILLYNKDIQQLTGKNEKGARRLINKIKEEYEIPPEVPLNIFVLSTFLRVTVESIRETIGKS